jgi:ubiquinone/menaquinone biosynthesis C-methylase UbiE
MTDHLPPARSFGSVAAFYDRGRPSYPRDAVAWLTAEQPLSVLELGAGTGKLTEQLVALGHDVHATDPDGAMLDVLRARLPDVRTSLTSAEDVPASDRAYDVVVVGQAFHWFDHERALPEIARVLKPGGTLAVVWNQRDERIPWVRKLGRIIGSPARGGESVAALERSRHFGAADEQTFKHWQVVDRESIQDLVRSRADVIALEEEARAAKVAEVLALYDDYGRGMDGMQLAYVTRCLRATVVDRPEPDPLTIERSSDGPVPPPTDDDSGMLLIDFR